MPNGMVVFIYAWLATAFLANASASYAEASLERTFGVCLQETMRVYKSVDAFGDYLKSLHLPPSNFGRFLSACMRSRGFNEPEIADQRCLHAETIESQAYCYAAK